jgi:polysaccharide export outer membrane protein
MADICNSLRHPIIASTVIFTIFLLSLVGCGPKISTPEQINAFDKAGLGMPAVGTEPNKVQTHTGPYRVVPGDLLEMQLSPILRAVSAELPDSLQKIEPYLCRVNYAGNITLPIVGQMSVANKELPEIEMMIANAYYPKYVIESPAIVCQVKEYSREKAKVFTVLGLVNHSDAFEYPPNVQYNLMEALAFAGGLNIVADPRYVKIFRQDEAGKVVSVTIEIQGETLSNTYAVLVKPGDVIYVDQTLQTRTNTFLSNVLSIRFGADVRPD